MDSEIKPELNSSFVFLFKEDISFSEFEEEDDIESEILKSLLVEIIFVLIFEFSKNWRASESVIVLELNSL